MKACVLRATGGLDRIALAQVPDPPPPGPGSVRVALHAAALNHLDLFVVRGLPGVDYVFPHVLGADGAGVVDAVGSGVRDVGPGDRVLINPGVSDGECEFCRAGEHSLCVRYRLLGEHLPGTITEFVTVPAANVRPLPDLDPPLSWAEAAAFSLVTLTAWRMLVTKAQVRAGDWVLIWGIGGGVAQAALQIARLRGARVIVTSSSEGKLERARALGAEVTLNHRKQAVAGEVRSLTGKRGADIVVDNVGEPTWEESLRCLAKGGRLVTCGATAGPRVASDVRRLFWNHLTIIGSTMGNEAEYREIVRVLGTGALRPVVDTVLPFDRAPEAFHRLESAEQFGKIAITVR